LSDARRCTAVTLAIAVAIVLVLVGPPPAVAAASTEAGAGVASSSSGAKAQRTVDRALDYLRAHQNRDGGFSARPGASSGQLTAWSILAIAAAGQDPRSWTSATGASPVECLANTSGEWKDATDYARAALAATAGGADPHSFGGVDVIARLQAGLADHGERGSSYGPFINTHIWSVLALRGAGEQPAAGSVTWLLSQQNDDGGWGWAPQVASDSNDTAAALEALAACGQSMSSKPVRSALDYLATCRAAGGGFAYTPGGRADANSTAWVVQGLVAAEEDPDSGRWASGSTGAREALERLQSADGSVLYTAGRAVNPLFVTAQSIPAFAARPFPLARGTAGRFAAEPTLSLVVPETLAAGMPVELTLKFDDAGGTGIKAGTLRVKLDGRTVATRAVSGGAVVGPVSLGAGPHTIAAVVGDRAGNVGRLAPRTFTVGRSASATSTATASATVAASGASPAAIASPGVAAPGAARAGSPAENTATTATADPATPAAPRGPGTALVVVAGIAALVAALAFVRAGRRS
jgi:prenyltransferase beta subunit